MAIFLLPSSKKPSQERFEKSIVKGIELSEIKSYVEPDLFDTIRSEYDRAKCWAFTKGKYSLWNKMNPGDIILFIKYDKQRLSWVIFSKSFVSAKDDNEKLARQIWGVDKKGQIWNYMFYLKNIEDVHFEISAPELGYDSNFKFSGSLRFEEGSHQYEVLHDLIDDDGIFPESADVDRLYEGAKEKVEVNRYERNSVAREICLKKNGHVCVICGFDFGKIYGDVCEGYIHVHHITPVSQVGHEYVIDAENDLIPICPNCHAAIHRYLRHNSLFTVQDMINLVKGWRGSVEEYIAQK